MLNNLFMNTRPVAMASRSHWWASDFLNYSHRLASNVLAEQKNRGTFFTCFLKIVSLMAYFHQQRRRWRRIPVRRVSLIITLYYTELFPLVWIWRQRWRLSLIITVPILGMDLHPSDRSPSQFYYILIRGLESVSIPVEKPV